MRFLTLLFLLISTMAFCQNDYAIQNSGDTSFLLVTQFELGNGETALSYEPASQTLDAQEILDYLFAKAEEQALYESRTKAREFDYNVQGNRLKRLLIDLDTNYYDITWSKYADRFTGRYVLRVQGVAEPIDIDATVNQAGRLIFRTDANVSAVRIESRNELSIVNLAEAGGAVDLFKTEEDPKRIIFRGTNDAGDRVALVKIK